MPKIELLNMDCMEYMKNIPDKHYELSICDPPYGINAEKSYGQAKTKKRFDREYKWDKSIPDDIYFQELFRISKNQIIWGGNYFYLPPSRCYIIWDKGESFKDRHFADCDYAWASFDRVARIFKYNPLSNGDFINKIHPTQKPVKLYKWLLHNYAKAGDKILDTHLGSGSSAIAAHDLDFDFTGIEIDKEYFEAAKKRLEQHQRQTVLF